MTIAALDFWFDLASIYSYPAATRIDALAGAAGVEVHFRPFLLGPIFKAQGWETSPFNLYPAKSRHMWRDLERICAELKLPLRRPELFPQSSLLAARVALVGLGEAWGRDFCLAVYRAEFADGLRIDQPTNLRAVLSDLSVDPERRLPRRSPTRSRTSSGRKRPKPNDWIFLVRRLLRRRTASCFGETTGSNPRSRGRSGSRQAVVPVSRRSALFSGADRFRKPAATADQVRGRLFPDHAYGSSRTGSPACAMKFLASRTENSPKWKIEAASTALA
jgi:2-hydroxychromene-2-carboxylate isomerase